MDFAAIQTAVQNAVVTATGLDPADVWWQGTPESTGWRQFARCELRLSGLVGSGIDEVRKTYTDGPNPSRSVALVGNRKFTVSVRIESDEQSPGRNAIHYAALLRTRIRRPDVLEALRVAGVSLGRILASTEADYVRDGRLVSLVITDVLLLAAEIDPDTQPESGEGWIDTAAGSADFDTISRTF